MWGTSFLSVMLLQENQAWTQDTKTTVPGELQHCSDVLRWVLFQSMEVSFLKKHRLLKPPLQCFIALFEHCQSYLEAFLPHSLTLLLTFGAGTIPCSPAYAPGSTHPSNPTLSIQRGIHLILPSSHCSVRGITVPGAGSKAP